MKTYVEVEGEAPFDWFKALNEPSPDWLTMDFLASRWTTCACGNQCDVIPRWSTGEPHDYTLSRLGGLNGFLAAIKNRDREEALNLLALIELRSAYLINKITNNATE